MHSFLMLSAPCLHVRHRSFICISVTTKYPKSEIWKNSKELIIIVSKVFSNDTFCLNVNFQFCGHFKN